MTSELKMQPRRRVEPPNQDTSRVSPTLLFLDSVPTNFLRRVTEKRRLSTKAGLLHPGSRKGQRKDGPLAGLLLRKENKGRRPQRYLPPLCRQEISRAAWVLGPPFPRAGGAPIFNGAAHLTVSHSCELAPGVSVGVYTSAVLLSSWVRGARCLFSLGLSFLTGKMGTLFTELSRESRS